MPDSTSWRKFKQDTTHADPPETDRIILAAEGQYERSGKPKGFAVFWGETFDNNTPQLAYRVYYFSPVASAECERALSILRAEESKAPSDTEEPLELRVGDPETAWDLLK